MSVGSHIHRLWNDRDNGRPAGVVSQRGNVRNNRHDEPFPPGTPIEGIIVSVERLGNQDEAVGAGLQSRRIIWVATWVDYIAFERLCLLVDLDCPEVEGSLVEWGRGGHGWSTGGGRRKEERGKEGERTSQVPEWGCRSESNASALPRLQHLIRVLGCDMDWRHQTPTTHAGMPRAGLPGLLAGGLWGAPRGID